MSIMRAALPHTNSRRRIVMMPIILMLMHRRTLPLLLLFVQRATQKAIIGEKYYFQSLLISCGKRKFIDIPHDIESSILINAERFE
jgi:hypothetical protein